MFRKPTSIKSGFTWLTVPAVLLSSQMASAACAPDAINLSNLSFTDYADQNIDNNYQVVDDGCSLFIGKNSWVASNETFSINENTILEFGYVGSAPGEIHGIGFDQEINSAAHGNRIFKVDWTFPDFGIYTGKKYQGGNAYEVYTVEIGKYFTGDNFHLVFTMDQDVDTGASGYYTNIRLVNKDGTSAPPVVTPTPRPVVTPTPAPVVTPTPAPVVTPSPTPDPAVNDAEFGVDQAAGVIFVKDDNYSGGFAFGCVNEACEPASLQDGRWTRSLANIASGSYQGSFKIQDNTRGEIQPSFEFTWSNPNPNAGGGGGNPPPGNSQQPSDCEGLDCLDWTTNSQPGNEVGPEPRANRPDALLTPENGAEPSNKGFAFDIEGDTLTWRWGPQNIPEGTPGDVGYTRTAGDSDLEMHCSEDNNLTFKSTKLSNGTATIPCSGVYTYFFRYTHPMPLNNDDATAWIYTALFTTADRIDVNNYPAFSDGSSNWMRWRHPIAHDGCTAAVSDACHNNSLLRHLDRYLIWFEDSPGNLQLNHTIEAGMKRVEAARHHGGSHNGQQQFTYNQGNGFGNEFSYGQVIQFEITSETPATSQVYNDFSYYTVGLGWGSYGDPRLNSAGSAGTTMLFSDTGSHSKSEYNAVFTQPLVTLNDEGLMNDFIVGHHIFHGIDPKVRAGAHDSVKIGERSCGDCHFRDGRGSEVVDTPRGPRLPPPVYGVKLLESLPGQQGFGWNASEPTVADQVKAALVSDHKVDPADVPPRALEAMTNYVEVLTVPNRKPGTYDQAGISEGEVAFNEMGCDSCHTPVQKTRSDVAPHLRDITIRAYTDMKVWNVNGGNYRTPALWGLGHNLDMLQRNGRDILFLHDGAASSVEEAIKAHSGDAASSRSAFNAASSATQQNVVRFVESL